MDKKSQNMKILRDLKAGKRITPMDALRNYNCWRLAARVYDLKGMGYPIEAEIIENDKGKTYAGYYLKGP